MFGHNELHNDRKVRHLSSTYFDYFRAFYDRWGGGGGSFNAMFHELRFFEFTTPFDHSHKTTNHVTSILLLLVF